jgi:hypothetical protein
MGSKNYWPWLYAQLCALWSLAVAAGASRRADRCGAHGSRGVMACSVKAQGHDLLLTSVTSQVSYIS